MQEFTGGVSLGAADAGCCCGHMAVDGAIQSSCSTGRKEEGGLEGKKEKEREREREGETDREGRREDIE